MSAGLAEGSRSKAFGASLLADPGSNEILGVCHIRALTDPAFLDHGAPMIQ